MNPIKALRTASGMTQQAFSEYFGFSRRAVQEWEAGRRECPVYLVALVEYKLRNEGILEDEAKSLRLK
jgi:DNA-binding transcriptional regulator YiaG